MKLQLRERALEDLDDIYRNLVKHDEAFAQRVERAVFEQLDYFQEFPELGTPTDEEEVRRWPMQDFRYTIFYRINSQDERLDVLRIIDSSRLRDVRRVPRS